MTAGTCSSRSTAGVASRIASYALGPIEVKASDASQAYYSVVRAAGFARKSASLICIGYRIQVVSAIRRVFEDRAVCRIEENVSRVATVTGSCRRNTCSAVRTTINASGISIPELVLDAMPRAVGTPAKKVPCDATKAPPTARKHLLAIECVRGARHAYLCSCRWMKPISTVIAFGGSLAGEAIRV